MVDKCDIRKAGLTLGVVFALCHLGWTILVLLFGKPFLSWIAGMHFISVSYSPMPLDFHVLIMGIVLAFASGAVIGSVFAYIYNKI